ncbi:hypothetical protein HS1genome_1380 [Sulfodiicoccus acidiphilus]|uniref:Uncharacterized protein n=2 Tax=Sulfodiicoccus acidiphilus TaxID=1670455 RepID=A0A348B489_9CREN|nr:hypothetical protein HS1genome_1380 [Sulfodiicoccus acidiphilus]GGT87512.1 hypothetical protein GCM10007116_01770 [Sulfodiicoccus acidiphilus]
MEWFGKDVVGIAALRSDNEMHVLILVDGIREISITARTEIWRKFYEALRTSHLFSSYVEEFGTAPRIVGILLSPEEVDYHIPWVVHLLLQGTVLLDPKGILKKAREVLKGVKTFQHRNGAVVVMGDLSKGEVVDL